MSENDKTSKPEIPREDSHLQELLEEAKRDAMASPEGVGSAAREIASVQFKDGKLRVGMGQEPPVEYGLGAEAGSHYEGPSQTLTSLRRWFNTAVTLLAIGIPVAIAILGIATGQTSETVFFMTIFGLLISGMFISSIRPRRTWLSDLLSDYLASAARRSRQRGATHVEPNRSQDPPV
jgi:hypothetical protein